MPSRIRMRVPRCSYALFWIIVSLLYGVIFVSAEFAGSPLSGAKGLVTLIVQWGIVAAAASAVIGLISISRKVFAVLFPILIALSATAAFFRLTLGTSLTANVIELAVVNNAATWFSLVSWQLVVVILIALTASIATAIYRYKYVRAPRKWLVWTFIFIILTLTPTCFIERFRAPVVARIPYVFWYSARDYIDNRQTVNELRTTFVATPVAYENDSVTVVVVIGESLRADHLGLNGYERNTTPRLSADSAVVSLPNIYTDQYYTHTSIPHILTRADSLSPMRAYDEQSFITLFNRANFRTSWISNQDQVKTYAYFMHETDTTVQCNAHRNLYSYEKWLDADMLADYENILSEQAPRKLIVVHSIGSHWWYRSHYPDSLAIFTPEIDSRVVSELSRDQMINSYDNTVLATDSFLSELTEDLRGHDAILIYISDHGEALGQNGNYLHADDFPELHNPACLVWYSASYAAKYSEKISALIRNSQKRMNTDIIFHSVLDAGGIKTPVTDGNLSVFR